MTKQEIQLKILVCIMEENYKLRAKNDGQIHREYLSGGILGKDIAPRTFTYFRFESKQLANLAGKIFKEYGYKCTYFEPVFVNRDCSIRVFFKEN